MKRLAMCGGNSGVAAATFRVGEKREYTSGRRKHYFRRRVGLEYVEIVLRKDLSALPLTLEHLEL
jgi:hypothetical protein